MNHKNLTKDIKVFSYPSSTTNCLAPLAMVVNDKFGIDKGLMTTVHAITSSQKTVDSVSNKGRRGRCALNNIIPSTTNVTKAIGKVIPSLNGKLSGMAFRVPVADVSVVDLTVTLKTGAKLEEVLAEIKRRSETDLNGILGYTEEMVVSQDFVGDSRISIVDGSACIQIDDHFIKLVSWYDNEWASASKIIELSIYANGL